MILKKHVMCDIILELFIQFYAQDGRTRHLFIVKGMCFLLGAVYFPFLFHLNKHTIMGVGRVNWSVEHGIKTIGTNCNSGIPNYCGPDELILNKFEQKIRLGVLGS